MAALGVSLACSEIIDLFEEVWDVAIFQERAIFAALHHPLLINLAYAFQSIEFLIMVMEVCHGGDIDQFAADGPHKLTSEQLNFVGVEVVAIVTFLHRKNVLYRDLKPPNLLLDDDGHVRLIDFGTAKMNPDENAQMPPSSLEECGSRPYMAPEVSKVLDTDTRYTYPCDYFSLGVMMYELAEKVTSKCRTFSRMRTAGCVSKMRR